MKKLVLALLMLGVLSGCSIKFAYNNLDRLIRWQISDYVDLNREQKAFLVAEVERVLLWHRKNHLPLYAEYLNQLPTQLSDGVTPDMLQSLFDQFFTWGEEVQAQALPVAIDMMVSLTDEQVAELPERLEKSNIEIEEPEKDVAIDRVQQVWADEFIDSLQRLVGRLDREQKQYVQLRATAYQPERLLWAEYRRRWQADLVKSLDKRADREAFARQFTALVDARESYYSKAFKAVFDANQVLSKEIAAHVLSDLTPRQSERFAEFFQELADDLSELANQA